MKSTGKGLRAVATAELRELAGELERGTFEAGLSRARFAAFHLDHVWPHVAGYVDLGVAGMKAVIDAVIAERDAPPDIDVALVWSGREGKIGRAQPTASVLASLFASARRDVLVAGYTFDHGDDLLPLLHAAMRDRGVEVEIFLHVEAAAWHKDSDEHVKNAHATFFTKNWPFGEPYPRIYIAPHTLDAGFRGNLHAKCVVVDERRALVGSANFTQRGQERNIEVGVRIESERFARDLVAQFHAAKSDGVFVCVAPDE